MSKRPSKLRQWTDGCMTAAFNEVRAGTLSIKAAAKKYKVPRMTLSDRVNGKVKMTSIMGVKTALTSNEEQSLCNYIAYMADRGFPLSIPQIKGFAWCIAKENGKGNIFTEKGPSRKWWLGFKKRHPELGLRRPDPLDRGRASLGCIDNLRDYFSLLKHTVENNGLRDRPECIYNCDEAALFLNKSAGQKVVVPTRMKHAHSLSVASNEHISVHCCVNAAGQAIPPMIIFSKSFPGGAYHRQGPVNGSYASSDSGFMDQNLYFQWFEKTFLPYAVPQRPILLIQDGASSHVSVELIRSAIQNDVILMCLPAKTTHITQPLDVAVYRKMKIETAKIFSQAKMVKSDLWVSTKQVSAIFKIIFEKSFTMECITEGFRKCGIYPFNPNAVNKSLLLRSCTETDPTVVDLSDDQQKQTQKEANAPDVSENRTDDQNQVPEEDPTPDISFEDLGLDISFVVGEDGVMTLQPPDSVTETVSFNSSTTTCPPELAFAAIESSLTPHKKRKFHECFNFNVDLEDKTFKTWKDLKLKTLEIENTCRETTCNPSNVSSAAEVQKCDPQVSATYHHPLVKAGLISENFINVLATPPLAKTTAIRKNKGKAKVLTSADVQRELEEKEAKKKQEIEDKIKRKQLREEKRAMREIEMKKRKEEILKRKEAREKLKAEKEKEKEEKVKQKKMKSISSHLTEISCSSTGHEEDRD